MRRRLLASLTLMVFSATAHGGIAIRSGAVEAVDAKNRTLVISVQGKAESFEVPDGTKISVGGKNADLADVREGMKASITFDTESRKLSRLSATADAPSKETPKGSPENEGEESPVEFEVLTAEWRSAHEFEYETGAFPSTREKAKVEPARATERLLVATVRCRWNRKLSSKEIRSIKKDSKGLDLFKTFKADAMLPKSAWMLGKFDKTKNAMELRECHSARKIEGDCSIVTVHSADKSKIPESTIFLSKPKNPKKPDEPPVMEIVWSHPKSDDSPILVVFPQPGGAHQPVSFQLKFSETGRFESAKPFENPNAVANAADSAK